MAPSSVLAQPVDVDTAQRSQLQPPFSAEAGSIRDLRPVVERYRRVALTLAMVVVGVLYVGSALTYGRSLRSTEVPVGFHAHIADALLKGRLEVLPVPKGLLELTDPYDPQANAPFRAQGYHDFALYKGRIFTATGPTTAFLVHVPARVLGLGNLNPNLVTLLCSLGGFVASVGVFTECRRRFFPGIPLWFELSVVFVIGLGSPVPWLVSIGRAYESAIACGYLLVALGLYCLVRGLRNVASPDRRYLFGSGAAFAAAVGARASLAPAIVFFAIALTLMVRHRRGTAGACLRSIAWLVTPYAAVGALLAAYNYLRFEALTDFGMTFQLAGVNMQKYPFYRLDHLVPNLVDYLTLPPRILSEWPFVFLQKNTFFDNPWKHSHEPVAGVLLLYPVLVVGVVAAATRWRSLRRAQPGLLVALASALLFALLVIFSVSFVLNSSTMRYTVDFVPVLALVACVAVGAALSLERPRSSARLKIGGPWVAAVALSCAISLALVSTPCPGTGSC